MNRVATQCQDDVDDPIAFDRTDPVIDRQRQQLLRETTLEVEADCGSRRQLRPERRHIDGDFVEPSAIDRLPRQKRITKRYRAGLRSELQLVDGIKPLSEPCKVAAPPLRDGGVVDPVEE